MSRILSTRNIWIFVPLSLSTFFLTISIVHAQNLDEFVDIDPDELNQKINALLLDIDDPELRARIERTRDDVEENGLTDANREEIQEILKILAGNKFKGIFGGFTDKIKGLFNKDDEDYEPEFDEFGNIILSPLDDVDTNEYKTDLWPDKDGTKIAKIVDPYGIERYTSDGKHFYATPNGAANSGSGIRNIVNSVSDTWDSFTGFFSFRGKLKDKDKELQRDIAHEVLAGAKSKSEKDIEKIYKKYEKVGKKITGVGGLGAIPASVIVESMKEASATEFAQGVLIYIEERTGSATDGNGRSARNIFGDPPADLVFGGFGGVSQAVNAAQPKAVLFSRYEEAYQRYLLAKELGRK